MKWRVFIGSSSEKLHIARAIESNLARDHEPTVWDEGIFGLSRDILSGLIDRLSLSDFAVLVLAPDDFTESRGEQLQTARDNVVFELGLFIGHLGRDRTFFVVPRGAAALHLPSDLLGLVPAEYDSKRSDANWNAALSPACERIRQAIKRVKPRTASSDARLEVLTEGVDWMQGYVNKALKALLTENTAPPAITGGDEEFRARIGRTDLIVKFGDIRNYDAIGPGSVVALPANEFFDDACINDARSSLGAYSLHAFPGRVAELQELIASKLTGLPSETVERENNEYGKSFGVATSIYLDNPLGSHRKLIFTSITTKRAGVGLRSESRYLFAAMKAICNKMNDQRLTHLCVPLMGSGHGGLEPELALLYLLLSCKALVDDARLSSHLREVTIVIYNPRTGVPAVQPALINRMLSVVART